MSEKLEKEHYLHAQVTDSKTRIYIYTYILRNETAWNITIYAQK